MKKYNYIYKITLLCGSREGQYYLGKHSTYRLNDGYAGSGIIIREYFKKYGRKEGETYTKEILEFNDTPEANSQREKEIIGDLWMSDPNCINLADGGAGGCAWNRGKKMNEDYCKKARERAKGKRWTESHRENFIKANTGRICSEETKKKIGIKNSGRKWTEEQRKTLVNNHKNIQYSRAKHVIQMDLEGNTIKKWHSSTVIEKELGFSHSSIINCCNGKLKQAYGFVWKYAA